jgi:DNA-binding MarR family transcriptional regulator
MRLEEEIKQPKFRNEHHKLAVNLIFTYGWFTTLNSKLLCEYNLTSSQFNILRILRGQYPNPATINMLKERMLDKMSDASRLVERLRLKGLVKRELSSSNRRQVDVIITKKGLDILSQIDALNNHQDGILKGLSETEAKNMNDLLDKMRS